MQWLRRYFSREVPRIPDPLWTACLGQLPFLRRHASSDADLARLKSLSETLLHKKTFTGAGGLDMTDEIAVLIAAQACLPILNLTLELYSDMPGVIVYPSAFVLPQSEMDEDGVVHEWREPVSGEAVGAGGMVVLSWEDVGDVGVAGYNVVIHEFVHKIDMRNGAPNGCPPFLAEFHQDLRPEEWRRTFQAAFEDFNARVAAFDASLPEGDDDDFPDCWPDHLPLDPYAARHPAEFFAVASEAFFVAPQALAAAYPGVFDLLGRYYRQTDRPVASLATRKTPGKHL